MKRSAGILPYKIIDNDIYVYLEHPGGPYWRGIEKYSICKGEFFKHEGAINAAIREFKEESGFDLSYEKIVYLKSHKVSNNKLVIMFVSNIDLDPLKMKSNTFEKELNGKIEIFPEMDKACWFKIDDAKKVIFESQTFFLEKLEQLVRMKRF